MCANFRESLSPARRHLKNLYIYIFLFTEKLFCKTYFGYFIGVWCVRHWISCFKYSKFYLHCNGDVIPSVTISIWRQKPIYVWLPVCVYVHKSHFSLVYSYNILFTILVCAVAFYLSRLSSYNNRISSGSRVCHRCESITVFERCLSLSSWDKIVAGTSQRVAKQMNKKDALENPEFSF